MKDKEFQAIYEEAERVIMNPNSSREEVLEALESVKDTGNMDAYQALQFQVGELASPVHLGGGFYVWAREEAEVAPRGGKFKALLDARKKR